MLGSVVAAFCGGPFLGVVVAHCTAPGSELAQVTSPLAFALTFAGGLMLWFGLEIVSVVGNALYRLSRGRWRWRWRRRSPKTETFVPPGYGVFLPLALVLGLMAGVVAGVVPQSGSFWNTCTAHAIAGGGYGVLLRTLAREGYLPFPEPS